MARTIPITVHLPAEVSRRLERLATATARSKSGLACAAIEAFLLNAGQEPRPGPADRRSKRRLDRDLGAWLDIWGTPKPRA